MTTNPPVAKWIRFNDAVTIVLRTTVCLRGEAEPVLISTLAEGSISAQRKLWRLDGGPHTSEYTELHPGFWTEDWRDKLEEGEPEGYVAEVEISHGGLREWLDGASSPSKAVKRGRPFEWDWFDFWREATYRAVRGELPETQAEFVVMMSAWFVKTTGDTPADSTIKDMVSPLYRRLKADN